MSCLPRWLALGSLTCGTLAAISLSPPASAAAADWCSSSPAPCIVSVTHGGTPVAADDPVWQVYLEEFDPGHHLRWTLQQNGSDALGPQSAGRWTVVVDTGTMVPRVVYGTGRAGAVVRTDDGDATYVVSASAEPTLVVEGCDMSAWPWVCPDTATDQATRLSAEISDWSNWDDPVQRAAFYGVDFWTNVSTTSFPPGVFYDESTGLASMALDFGAPHYETDGSTVVRGHFEAVLPNDFLRENFFIPDPTTMTPAGLAVGGGGPVSSSSVTKASASSPITIEVTDMTFSIRKLRVRTGTIVPTRPGDPRATRVSGRVGKVAFDRSTPRGAKVTGYRARCVSTGGHVRSATRSEDASPVKVRKLRAGVPYTCRVRALSEAGAGRWSSKATLRRK